MQKNAKKHKINIQGTCELSPKIIDNLAKIERTYGTLDGLRLPSELQLNLERDNLVQSTYVSNSIEGNPLSLPEVTNLLLGERMPVNRDEKEVQNYFNILKKLSSQDNGTITVEHILAIHKQLLTGVRDEIAGNIRSKRVIVGGYKEVDGEPELQVKHEPPAHNKDAIYTMLHDLCDWFNTNQTLPAIVKIALFHHRFVYIHPFIDGNGRTCRLLTAELFLQAGYEINKYFVLDDYYDIDRLLYSDSLHKADSGDCVAWVEYFTGGVKYSLMSALSNAKQILVNIQPSLRPTEREAEVLQIVQNLGEVTSVDIAKRLGVSRQLAHRLLTNLVKGGYIKKYGKTKQSFYRLA